MKQYRLFILLKTSV